MRKSSDPSRTTRTRGKDVDPNQAPGGQNKPSSEGGRAGRVSGDRNTRNHPGFNTNKS